MEKDTWPPEGVPGSASGQAIGGGNQDVRIIRSYDPDANIWPSSSNRFSDDGGKKIMGDLISMLRNDYFVDFQYAWFIPKSGYGLTNAGLGRINRSVEAFVYCVYWGPKLILGIQLLVMEEEHLKLSKNL